MNHCFDISNAHPPWVKLWPLLDRVYRGNTLPGNDWPYWPGQRVFRICQRPKWLSEKGLQYSFVILHAGRGVEASMPAEILPESHPSWTPRKGSLAAHAAAHSPWQAAHWYV